MQHWRYKAYDQYRRTHLGVVRARREDLAILELRRHRRLQVYELIEIDAETYVIEARRQTYEHKLRDRIARLSTDPDLPPGPATRVMAGPIIASRTGENAYTIRSLVLTIIVIMVAGLTLVTLLSTLANL